MSIQLTAEAQQIVARLRAHKQSLIEAGYTGRNANERVLFEHGDINGVLASYAIGRADIRELAGTEFEAR